MAIVDDDEPYSKRAAELSKKVFAEAGRELKVECFQEVGDLGEYDIYLLDIVLPGKNGLELAKEVRSKWKDAYIIMLTNHEQYALLGYEWHVYGYLLKTGFEDRLKRLLREILEETANRFVFYEIRDSVHIDRFCVEDILYLESEGKYVRFHLKDRECRERASLREAADRLPVRDFLQIDRGTMINMKYVSGYRKGQVELTGGILLAASEKRTAQIRRKLTRYLGGMT